MRWMRVVVALLVALGSVSPGWARERTDGQTYSESDTRHDGIATDGSEWKVLGVDASGRLYVRNASGALFNSTIIYSGSITAGTRNTASPKTAQGLNPYEMGVEHRDKMWRVVCSSATDAATPWSVSLWGSMDGSNYGPIFRQPPPFTPSAETTWLNQGTMDTLKVVGRGAMNTLVSNGGWMPLSGANGEPIRFPYIIAVASSDSLGGTNTVTLTVEIAGAEQ